MTTTRTRKPRSARKPAAAVPEVTAPAEAPESEVWDEQSAAAQAQYEADTAQAAPEAPEAEVPEAEVPEAEVPEAPEAEVPEAEVPALTAEQTDEATKPVTYILTIPAGVAGAFTEDVEQNWPMVTLVLKTTRKTSTGSGAAAREPGLCVCGCGETTGSGKAKFVRGHDSKLGKALRAAYADGSRSAEDILKVAASVSERFTGKITRSIAAVDADRAAAAEAEKAGRALLERTEQAIAEGTA